MNLSHLLQAEELAEALVEGLRRELYLTPKPGLVDLWDNGSHRDLDLEMMDASIELIEEYQHRLLEALRRDAPLKTLVAIGQDAEVGMFKRFGTNTHKGAIFLCGLLVAAQARSGAREPAQLSAATAELAEEFFALGQVPPSHGKKVRQRFGRGGIILEALRGLPALFQTALPAWRDGIALCGDPAEAGFFVLARLMQQVEDTTALHRCGELGLARLRQDGRFLEAALSSGRSVRQHLTLLNEEYCQMNLTMGGVADLLGVAFGYLEYRGELKAEERAQRLPGMALPGGYVCL
ncbi:2-(5''-triphosphoribosyl)-3'-dephospho-CoA synthase [Desulfuromonas versatilis]|uniref:triphosphoribosyl-dephospho-CoA synthase n=1 Tax=Desulfuromonas versatilis TaxID=2802975 RepID=A0ABM8HY69_9BACT|nr:triphosphoribosyl-dephospho-CoA synthase [Desulfuromonas versatilis]BCR05531.1 2-(5''-triphosphoribosyl)-3'-dephospho-CoA synthase [Desulfuromonas versatilis]